MTKVVHQIERLQTLRARRKEDFSIVSFVATTVTNASRTHTRLGELIELWERLVPAELASHTSITCLRSGVLHVLVESSSMAFELDRLLRNGLTAELRRQFRGTLVRVKTRIGKCG